MEISPIPGIRALPVVKTPSEDTQLSAVLNVENSSAPGDDTYSGNGKKAAGGEEDDDDTASEATESSSQAATDDAGGSIDCFA